MVGCQTHVTRGMIQRTIGLGIEVFFAFSKIIVKPTNWFPIARWHPQRHLKRMNLFLFLHRRRRRRRLFRVCCVCVCCGCGGNFFKNAPFSMDVQLQRKIEDHLKETLDCDILRFGCSGLLLWCPHYVTFYSYTKSVHICVEISLFFVIHYSTYIRISTGDSY